MTTEEKPYHEIVAEVLIKQLKEGTAPWQKPWDGKNRSLPHNPITGTRYRGGNLLHLKAMAIEKGYKDSRWITVKQANNLGGWVKKGEKGTIIEKWQFFETRKVRDEEGRFLIGPDGKPQLEEVRLSRPKRFAIRVYNFEQVIDLPKFKEAPRLEFYANARAEEILKESGAEIFHDEHDRAYYRMDQDEIHLPSKEQFKDESMYYATALHELGHWTRHPERLNRESGRFGTPEYAEEELRAEIASMILGEELGIGHDPSQHASYVESWIYVLENDPKVLFRAARESEKIFDYVMSFEKDKLLYEEKYKTAEIEPEKPREKIFLTTEFKDKEEVKSLGARYSKDDKSWYIYAEEENKEKFTKWIKPEVAVLEEKEAKEQSTELKPPLEKIYINVNFKEKNEAKELGAKWDKASRAWYINEDQNKDDFTKWLKPNHQEKTPEEIKEKVKEATMNEKVYLQAEYKDRFEVKKLGARWDGKVKSWYVPEGMDISKFQKWISKPQVELSPVLQFKSALRQAGILVDAPIMDGNFHRVAVEGDKPGQESGSYKAFLDGHPNGVITNFKAGIEGLKWKAEGKYHGDMDVETLVKENTIKRKLREVEVLKEREIKSLYATEVCKTLKKDTLHPYLEKKGLSGEHFQNERGEIILPLQDLSGKIWSLQTIRWNGDKQLLKGGKMAGTFYPLNEFAPEKKTFVAEGFATALSIKKAVGEDYNVIMTVSAGNILPVVKDLARYQDANKIVICGDDDHKTIGNPGRSKALEAAKEVGCLAIFPKFNQTEKEKKLTDFNDLHVSRGMEVLKSNLSLSNSMGLSR